MEVEPPIDAAAVLRQLTHELRQPLSTIESIAYYLGMRLPREDHKMHQQLEKLQQIAGKMGGMLCDALHFLQASPVHMQLLDLHEIMTETIAEAHPLHGDRFRLELSGAQALVRMDAAQARHMVSALLCFGQAVCADGSKVRIRSRAGGDQRMLEVLIPGACFDPQQRASLMEPFSPHAPAGQGLGLASVRRIAEVHGGGAEVQSWEENGAQLGVSLRVSLPRGN